MAQKQSISSKPSVAVSDSKPTATASAGGTALTPPPPSDSDAAIQQFAEQVGGLPGVLRVERWGKQPQGGRTFHVYVRPDDLDTEYAIYELQGQVYDRCFDAHLDVVVLEEIEAPMPPHGGTSP